MKVIRYYEYGGADKLVYEEMPVPEPAAGEVLVRIHASGVNPWDWKFRSGRYRDSIKAIFPIVPGVEASGVIERAGPGVTKFRSGQEVFGGIGKSYAEYAVVKEDQLSLKPGFLNFPEAAAIMVASQTAWASLFDIAGLESGQKILIHAAAGSVGIFAVGLAKWKGAFVYATASAENNAFLRSIGVDEVIDYSKENFEDIVKDADVVFDPLGGETQVRSFPVLKKGGILISIVSTPSQELCDKYGVRARYRNSGISKEGLEQIPKLVEQRVLKPFIRKIYPLEQARQAHESGESGHGRGKIILQVI
jgi:NADPH:quinone reductase-like Zn-dependent oxidoreductase